MLQRHEKEKQKSENKTRESIATSYMYNMQFQMEKDRESESLNIECSPVKSIHVGHYSSSAGDWLRYQTVHTGQTDHSCTTSAW